MTKAEIVRLATAKVKLIKDSGSFSDRRSYGLTEGKFVKKLNDCIMDSVKALVTIDMLPTFFDRLNQIYGSDPESPGKLWLLFVTEWWKDAEQERAAEQEGGDGQAKSN